MIFNNCDLGGQSLTSSTDATTPCDVEMVPVLGAHDEAGGICLEVPDVAAEEEVYPLDDQADGITSLKSQVQLADPLTQGTLDDVTSLQSHIELADPLTQGTVDDVTSLQSLIELANPLTQGTVDGVTSLQSLIELANPLTQGTVDGVTSLQSQIELVNPLTQGTAVPLTIVGVETTEDLVAIDLVAVTTVTTDLSTPSTDTTVGLDFGSCTSLAPATPNNWSIPSFAATESMHFKAPECLPEPLDLSTPTRETISLALELASPTTTAELVSAAAGGDSILEEAAMKAFTSGCMTPIIKEELKCSIQNKRLSEGKEELEVELHVKKGEEKLSPDEVEKRIRRRERNRLAAQRCRQRRQETGESFEKETKDLERKNKKLQEEICSLEEEKKKLMEMLLWHDGRALENGACRHRLSTSSTIEDMEEEDSE